MSNIEKNKYFKEKIVSKKMFNSEILSLKINKPKNFTYISGQFIQIKIANKNSTNNYILRPYSLTSVPNDNYLELCVKLLKNGTASNYLKNIKEKNELSFTNSDGNFIYKNIENKKIFFIATGVGLSPIFSIIKDELKNKNNKNEFHLFFTTRKEKDIIWEKELKELKNIYNNFNYKIILSQAEKKSKKEKSHVTDLIKNSNIKNSIFFVCGNPDMIRDLAKFLLEKKIDINDIHFEIFE